MRPATKLLQSLPHDDRDTYVSLVFRQTSNVCLMEKISTHHLVPEMREIDG